jgi:ABC-type uncharacterized transport system ATPase subunit
VSGVPTPRLRAHGIEKRFGSVIANDRVDFQLAGGEVHGVLGENGAGKSTFTSILSGLYHADAGEIFIDGEPVVIRSPRGAIAAGIGTVYQHFMLIPALSVGDNIRLAAVASMRNWRRLGRHSDAAIAAFAEEHGLPVPVGEPVAGLSLALRQRIEIVKALYWGSRILILDEPTAVLTPDETDALLTHVRTIADAGCSVIFITHKLDEVTKFCDRVTVFRRGRVVAERVVADVTTAELAHLMVGHAVSERGAHRQVERSEVVAEAKGLEVRDRRGHVAVSQLDLRIHAGEIVGIASVEGNGEVELAEALYGVRSATAGSVLVLGTDVTGLSVARRQKLGIRSVPQDRLAEGLIADFSIIENLALDDPQLQRGWLRPISRKKLLARTNEVLETYDVRSSGPKARARQLSGGNQQKVVLARALSSQPRLVIASHPFRGLDIGASAFVRDTLLAARDGGAGILLISPDLDEVLSLADTICVMRSGSIVATIPADAAERHEVGRLMLGAAA